MRKIGLLINTLIEKNPLLVVIGKLHITVRIISMVVLFFLLVATWLLTKLTSFVIAKCFFVVFMVLGFLLWCFLISLCFQRPVQGRIVAFVFCLFCVSLLFGLSSDVFFTPERTLVCTEINPDGVQIAEGYHYETNNGGESVVVYIKTAKTNSRGEVSWYPIYDADGVDSIEMKWLSNTDIEINGKVFVADRFYLDQYR